MVILCFRSTIGGDARGGGTGQLHHPARYNSKHTYTRTTHNNNFLVKVTNISTPPPHRRPSAGHRRVIVAPPPPPTTTAAAAVTASDRFVLLYCTYFGGGEGGERGRASATAERGTSSPSPLGSMGLSSLYGEPVLFSLCTRATMPEPPRMHTTRQR